MSKVMSKRIAVLALMMLALLVLSACGGASSADSSGGGGGVSTPVSEPDPAPAPDPEPVPAPDPGPEADPAPEQDQSASGDCAYEGDPTCPGYVPDDPVPGQCTPDFAGDPACQSNEELLDDMADLNSDRINNGGW